MSTAIEDIDNLLCVNTEMTLKQLIITSAAAMNIGQVISTW